MGSRMGLSYFWWLISSALIGLYATASAYSGMANVNIDLHNTHPVSDKLYGIFFEEISNAGEGGLFAEMIQDRSFDALAHSTGFLYDNSSRTLELTPEVLAAAHAVPWGVPQGTRSRTGEQAVPPGVPSSKDRRHELPGFLGLKAQPQSWFPYPATAAVLTKELPLHPFNVVAMKLSTADAVGGIANTGFWGIPVLKGREFNLRLYLALPQDATPSQNGTVVRVSLESANGQTSYASVSFTGISRAWKRFEAKLGSPGVDDTSARLSVAFNGPGSLLLDFVSLFPAENTVPPGELNPRPFRTDLLDMLKGLKPRFMRFPGGCYVEGGDWLKDAFIWKNAVGPAEERPGHWNANWGYWSTDGLGLFEYMQLAEELGAEPVWVINNGISHREDTPIPQIDKWVQDGLDSIEFTNGGPGTTWGSLRAAMGRVEPWNLTYFAIGNEDCGHPSYVGSYIAFFYAIRAKYPHMRLIANCNMGTSAPTDLWDWHVYVYSWDMYNRRNDFNGVVPGRDPYIFASEYASVGDAGWGNLIGAIGEAGFMTGLDRNSQAVQMASYAPLLVNANSRVWTPDLIVFNNHQAYGIPSYYVQKLFSETLGQRYAWTGVEVGDWSVVHNELVAASTTCQDDACTSLAIKLVNMASFPHNVTVRMGGIGADDVNPQHKHVVLAGPFPEAENSFDNPTFVAPRESEGP
eukprot:jgi/Botrbrau1/15457/Bobra.43_2s0082.2